MQNQHNIIRTHNETITRIKKNSNSDKITISSF